jgi:hypothetical protein
VTPAPCDRIVQNGKAGADASVILVDARRDPAGGSCVDDEVRRAPGTDTTGNLLAPAACASEVAVFASGNAMALRENVTAWTDTCGDTLTVDLAPLLSMPGTLFLAVPDLIAQAEWGLPVEDEAAADLKLANAIYDANKTGISFVMPAKELGLVEGLGLLELIPKIVEALADGFDPVSFVCELPASLESKGLYVKDQLNVYYLPVPGTGMMCPDDPNAIFVALNKNLETLAHEFGHSLSLLGDWGHTNTAPGFASNNLMWVRGDDVRDHLSLGQAFRLNVEDGSMLNVDGVRLEPTRPCAPELDTVACPPLALDWVRP